MEPNSVVKDVKKLSNYLQHFDANEDLGITSYLKSDQFEIKKLKNSNKLLKKNKSTWNWLLQFAISSSKSVTVIG